MRASEHWREFWDNQEAIDDAYWEQHIRHFLACAADVLPFGPDDVVLDIGAGTGHFARAVAPLVREVHCLEASPRYARECERRLANLPNAFVHQVPPGRPGSFKALGRSFTRINCLSVIQYFDEPGDFEAMLAALKPAAAPDALLLVGDIRIRGSLLADLAGSIAGGLRAGLLGAKLRLLWRMFRSQYRTARKAKLLDFSQRELLQAAENQGLDASFVKRRLTMNATRRHMLIRF